MNQDTSLLDFIGQLVCGLGLMLLGVRFAGEGLTALCGRRLRAYLRGFGRGRLHALIGGALYGFVSVSDGAAPVMAAGYLACGVLSGAAASVAAVASGLGLALACLVISLPVWEFSLVILGVAAIFFFFLEHGWPRHLSKSCLGLGLFFTGIFVAGEPLVPIAAMSRAEPWLLVFNTPGYAGLLSSALAGLALTLFWQSSLATFGLTLSFAVSGLITPAAAAALMAGASLTRLLTPPAVTLLPATRRVFGLAALVELVAILGCLAALPLILPAIQWLVAGFFRLGIPWIEEWIVSLRTIFEPTLTVTLFVCCFRLVAAALILPLASLAGTTTVPAVAVALPTFLRAQTADAETAMDLLDEDLAVVIGRFNAFTAAARRGFESGDREGAKTACDEANAALTADLAPLNEAVHSLLNHPLARRTASRLLNLAKIVETFHDLQTLLSRFASAVIAAPALPPIAGFIESLDLLLLAAADAEHTRNLEDVGMLRSLTEDRGETLERSRAGFLQSRERLSEADQANLLFMIGAFERCVGALRRLANLLGEK